MAKSTYRHYEEDGKSYIMTDRTRRFVYNLRHMIRKTQRDGDVEMNEMSERFLDGVVEVRRNGKIGDRKAVI